MITKVHIQNYRSIVDATVELSPFTLLIGANGTGKSNFLRLFEELSDFHGAANNSFHFEKHYNHQRDSQKIDLSICDNGKKYGWSFAQMRSNGSLPGELNGKVRVYSIDPNCIGEAESLEPKPTVNTDGSGAVKVLDSLKTGDREDLFDKIENDFKKFIPEIEKLSFIPGTNAKQLQVREKHIEKSVPVATLSEGTRLILTILTIIHQENPPKFIGLEEIDRGLHPRLFQKLLERLHYITREKDIQIVATTHNPYLIDQFKDREEAVIIVEKEDGATTFTSLEDKLDGLEPDEMPLGSLWYSGIVGGVPEYAR